MGDERSKGVAAVAMQRFECLHCWHVWAAPVTIKQEPGTQVLSSQCPKCEHFAFVTVHLCEGKVV